MEHGSENMSAPQTLMVFIDGLGLGPVDPAINPIYRGYSPRLADLLENHAVAVDPVMGVKGLPQSATGQTTIITGRNASEIMGRHMEGFPGPTLVPVIEENNLYDRLQKSGFTCTFANAYYLKDMEELYRRRHWSVSTVAAMKAFGWVRNAESLLSDCAVHQDLTRAVLRERGYTGPIITPAEAGGHLLGIAEQHDFTLFEYFQTDLMAHKGSDKDIHRVLSELDEFINALLPFGRRDGCLLILLSDHGNIEDSRSRQHTMNPVPLVAMGKGGERLKDKVLRLDDFAGTLLELYHTSPVRQIRMTPK